MADPNLLCMPTDSPFDRARAVKATAAALAAIVVLAGVSMVLLDHGDFVDWGWLLGPSAWIVACIAGARFAGLSVLAGLCGAAIAGIPSLLATLTGIHWLGIVFGLVAFAAWSGSGRAARLRIG